LITSVPSKVSEKYTLAETERVALAKTSATATNDTRARRRTPPAREKEEVVVVVIYFYVLKSVRGLFFSDDFFGKIRHKKREKKKTRTKKRNGSRGHRHRPSERVHERLRAIGEEMHETRPTRVHAHREQDGFWCVYLFILFSL
jgi:hypothetical protein